MAAYLAFDLGASSGRAMLGRLDGGRLEIEEAHRFSNGGTDVNGNLHWNILGLFEELKTGLRKALAKEPSIAAVAVDTWGVDFALIDANGSFAGFPYHYRDSRTDNAYATVLPVLPRAEIYEKTGIQLMPINTLFQLAVMQQNNAPALQIADKLLMMPNALTYLLCGDISAEYSIATTSQLFDPFGKDWSWELIDRLKLPRHIFPPIKQSCTVVGKLRDSLCAELNCSPIPVVLVGSHDTASAVAAVPVTHNRSWAYISSGTWSLLGVELDAPRTDEGAKLTEFTNEGGVGGKIRFLKNIMGLWLVQESRATWTRRGENYTYDELDSMAAEAEPFRSLIDPRDQTFSAPGDMPARFADFCARTGQPVPATPGQVIRCALESLALCYRFTIDELEKAVGRRIEVLHIVGGGVKNLVLNQFTANAVDRPVLAGPVEATATGNLLGQAMAMGEIADLGQLRQVVRASSTMQEYTPRDTADWAAAYARYRKLLGG